MAEVVASTSRRSKVAAVVGVGGGSALDMSKLAAVAAANPGSVAEYFTGRQFETPPVPLVLIPTTSGTGAESSRNAVISLRGRKAFASSQFLLPSVAILDPELTATLPPATTAWTGIDALSHCIEAMFSLNASALTDAAAVSGVQIIVEYLPAAYLHGSDIEARAQMQVAAYLGGLALNAGMVIGHSIAYTLANRLGLAHGLSCALALPVCIAVNLNAVPGKRRLLARALGVMDDLAEVLDVLRRLVSSMGIPSSWQEVGLNRLDLPSLVDDA